MKWQIILATIFVGSHCSPTIKADDKDHHLVRYELQVFRLDGAFRSQTSLSAGIQNSVGREGATADRSKSTSTSKTAASTPIQGSPKQTQDAVTLFNEGQFDWENNQLKLNSNGCFWNGKKLTFEEGYRESLPDGQVKMIYSPTVIKPLGKLVRLKIESDTPFQYMKQTTNGTFKLQELTLPVGMNLEVRAKRNPKGGFRIEEFQVELRSIGSRAEIPGVTLPVGKPELRKWNYQLQFNASPRKGYGILVQPEGTTGALLIRIALTDKKSI